MIAEANERIDLDVSSEYFPFIFCSSTLSYHLSCFISGGEKRRRGFSVYIKIIASQQMDKNKQFLFLLNTHFTDMIRIITIIMSFWQA